MNKLQYYQFDTITKFIDYRGKTPTKTDSGIPLITAKNIKFGYLSDEPQEFIAENDYDSWMVRGIPNKGDVLFTTEAPLGNVCLLGTDDKRAFAQRVIVFQPLNDNTYVSPYLFYYFMSPIFMDELDFKKTGSTVKGIKSSILKKFQIPLPPLLEQQRIVSKLDKLFEKIDKAIALHQKNIDEANVFMRSVLNDIFIELEEKYEKFELTKFVNFNGGSQPPKSQFSEKKLDSYVRLIQIRDYKSDNYIVYVQKNSVRKFCTEDDVMIGRYGPPVFQILKGIDGAYNVALMKAEPNEEFISKEFLFKFLQNPNIQNYIIGLSQRSAGQSGVNKEALEKYPISIPPLSIQQKVVTYLDDISEKIEKVKSIQKVEMDTLKALKASILDKAFRGEL